MWAIHLVGENVSNHTALLYSTAGNQVAYGWSLASESYTLSLSKENRVRVTER